MMQIKMTWTGGFLPRRRLSDSLNIEYFLLPKYSNLEEAFSKRFSESLIQQGITYDDAGNWYQVTGIW